MVCCRESVLLVSSSWLTLALDRRKGGLPQGRRGAAKQGGGGHSSGILLGWSIFAANSMYTIDVNISGRDRDQLS
ncbi:hypothetical protein J4Q44_G00325320 [Coregonus suidteri]|uniref:Uncharacterized protein n=1 Tax=Coregonus suidteri TaxID=861788 RepID=A0AAN8Q9H0_9TELE